MTEYPESVIQVLELAKTYTPVLDVPPELRDEPLTFCKDQQFVLCNRFHSGHPHFRFPECC
jgi:hypothetical protein